MEIEIEGTVIVASDGSRKFTVEWVTYNNRAWLAPLWIESYDGQWIRPVRLIAPKWAPGYDPVSGPEVLEFFQKVPVPTALLESEGHRRENCLYSISWNSRKYLHATRAQAPISGRWKCFQNAGTHGIVLS